MLERTVAERRHDLTAAPLHQQVRVAGRDVHGAGPDAQAVGGFDHAQWRLSVEPLRQQPREHVRHVLHDQDRRGKGRRQRRQNRGECRRTSGRNRHHHDVGPGGGAERPHRERLRRRRGAARLLAGTDAAERTDFRNQVLADALARGVLAARRRRLGHVVGRAVVERFERVGRAALRERAEHDHGQPRVGLADLAQRLEPVHPGQLDVERHEIRLDLGDPLERRTAVLGFAGHFDGRFGRQCVCDDAADQGGIVHDQDPGFLVHACRPLGQRPCPVRHTGRRPLSCSSKGSCHRGVMCAAVSGTSRSWTASSPQTGALTLTALALSAHIRTPIMIPRVLATAAILLLRTVAPATADDLSSRTFHLQTDASGITSLKRAGDVADTDYIASGGALGRLIVRYRTTAHGDWKELRDLILTRRAAAGTSEVGYELGARLPPLASRASGSAVQGVAGLRGLNDGIVPRVAGGGGRGGPPSGFGTAGASPADVPIFTWSPTRGTTQWVQYTFPDEETIGRTEVFWTVAPQSWRLLYQTGGQWKEVAPSGPYGREVNRFTTVEFTPVKTMALRIEVTLSPDAPPALAEWQVGPDAAVAPAPDLKVAETFKLQDEALEWTVVLANEGSRPVEIGDLAVPLAFAERTGARGDIYTKKLLRHALVNGHGSWVYWQRSNAVGPYLVLTPEDAAKFEYYESAGGVFTPYVHATAATTAARAAGGTWRLPVSSLTLAPGTKTSYTFRFQWAKDVGAVRDVLYREGKLDTVVAPGMVVPSDLPALLSLRSRHPRVSIQAEFPAATRVEPVP